jgi:hypothetical protein
MGVPQMRVSVACCALRAALVPKRHRACIARSAQRAPLLPPLLATQIPGRRQRRVSASTEETSNGYGWRAS